MRELITPTCHVIWTYNLRDHISAWTRALQTNPIRVPSIGWPQSQGRIPLDDKNCLRLCNLRGLVGGPRCHQVYTLAPSVPTCTQWTTSVWRVHAGLAETQVCYPLFRSSHKNTKTSPVLKSVSKFIKNWSRYLG